jgi:hypothetical protein
MLTAIRITGREEVTDRTTRRIICLATLGLALLLPSPAWGQSGITGQTISNATESHFQDPVDYGPASLQIVWDTTYNPAAFPTSQTLQDATIHFDNEFAFDTTGIAQCPPASLTGTTTAAAIAACPTAVLGTGGNATLTGGSMGSLSIPAVVTSFNAVPSGSDPQVLLHIKTGPPATATPPLIATGTIGPSTRGGEFTQISFFFPDTSSAGITTTHMDARFGEVSGAPGHYFYSARCPDTDNLWDYHGDFTFRSGGGMRTASQIQPCNRRELMSTSAAVTFGSKKKCKHKKKCRKGK